MFVTRIGGFIIEKCGGSIRISNGDVAWEIFLNHYRTAIRGVGIATAGLAKQVLNLIFPEPGAGCERVWCVRDFLDDRW